MTLFLLTRNSITGDNHILKYLKSFINVEKILKFLKVADNKDKILKTFQYIVKLIILTRGHVKPLNGNAADLKSFTSLISLARKLGRLGNWFPGLQDLYELSSSGSVIELTGTLASVGNDILDDWICLQKGRLLMKKPYLDILDAWSTRLWFISTTIELNFTVRKLKNHLKVSTCDGDYLKKRTDLILTGIKQICDWIFCVWELRGLERYNEHVPIVAGLSAALVGVIRGWRKIK